MNFGFRSRSCRVIQDSSPPPAAAMAAAAEEEREGLKNEERCCWGNMPLELVREVLMRIESSENNWPLRKNVVACGGVCRSWREIVKEIVGTPEVSGILTFPISVKQVRFDCGITPNLRVVLVWFNLCLLIAQVLWIS